MPENADTPVEGGKEKVQADGFKAITSQDELDRIIQNRLDRVYKKFADYDELSAAAARANEQATELEKKIVEASERADNAEQKLGEAALEKDRLEVIVEYGITGEARDLLTATDREGLEAQAKTLSNLVPRGHSTMPERTGRSSAGDIPKDAAQVFGDWAKRTGLI